jgi:hypothetical protein
LTIVVDACVGGGAGRARFGAWAAAALSATVTVTIRARGLTRRTITLASAPATRTTARAHVAHRALVRGVDASFDRFTRRVINGAGITAHQHAGRIQTGIQIVEALTVHGRTAPAHTAARIHRTAFVHATVRITTISAALTHAALSVIAQATARFALRGARLFDASRSFSVASRQRGRVSSSSCDTSILRFLTTLDFVRERQIGGRSVGDAGAARVVSG